MGVKDQYLPFFEDPVVDVRDYKVGVWRRLPKEEQDQWIEEVFDYYRNIHGFPYFKRSDDQIYKLIWRLRNKVPRINGDIIKWDPTGSVLCSIFFPHIWDVQFRKKRTAMSAYNDDKVLRQAIRLCFQIKPSAAPGDLIGAFTLGTNASVGVVSRFKPLAAKAIWERYAPEHGLCYDYACGWGGRLLGCLASKKKLEYVGVDPEPRTFGGLNKLYDTIRGAYKDVHCVATIHKKGSEDFCPPDLHNQVDVAFSSPPYFDLEKYSDDPTQSHVKFPDVDQWLDGYLLETFKNVHMMLKPGTGILALNLLDFDGHKICDGALERIRSLGFVEVETLGIQMAQRRGQGQTRQAFKTEPVYVFRKPL